MQRARVVLSAASSSGAWRGAWTWFFVGALPVSSVRAADASSPPAGYYASTVGLSGDALDRALHAIISGHTVRTYAQLRQDLAVADRDPAFPAPAGNPAAATRIFLIYSEGWSGYSRSGVWDAGATWNREHCWPDSRGVGQPDEGPDFSDMHHLRAANPAVNSARSNRYYDDIGGSRPAHANAPLARGASQAWEPPATDKGWIARALAYMATRYDGTETNTTDLVLVETPPASTSGNPPQMGRKSTILRWNRLHAPSEWERARNQIIYSRYQRNRNPFIDHPEFADMIYEAPQGRETRLTWRYRHFSLDELTDDAVSGDLADPDGDGAPNLLELALGTDPRAGAAPADRALRWERGAATGRLRVSYPRLRDRALSGLGYEIEVSSDLTSWTAAPEATEGSVTPDAAVAGVIERVTVEFKAETNASIIFARLRVER